MLRLQEVHQVPKFIEYFVENNCNYLVEEYIEGSSLEDLLTHQWNIENIIIFLWDILSILQLLHHKNIVHRDIKPSNLIQRKKIINLLLLILVQSKKSISNNRKGELVFIIRVMHRWNKCGECPD